MKKLFLLLIIFACATVYAQDEIWTVKKTVSEVYIEDGDTLTEEYLEEFSLSLKNDSALPLSFFLGMPEEWMTPENFEGARKKESKGNFAGLIQLPVNMSYKELYDKYGDQLGNREDLASALQNPVFNEFLTRVKNSEVIAVTLSGVFDKTNTTRQIIASPRNQTSHFKGDKKEVFYIPHNGEGSFFTTPCPQCHQTLMIEKIKSGNEELYETFFLENSIQYDGWKDESQIVPKGTWIFVTQFEDPYYWE